MRPVPSRNHHWAVLVLLAVAAGNTWLTFHQDDLTGAQANLMAEVYQRGDPGLFPHDDVFGPGGPVPAWRLHLPAWQALLASALRWSGDDPLLAFRLVGAVTITLYLLAMYVLLYRQTRSTPAATYVAVLSLAVFSYRRAYWGAGPLFSVEPETLFLAAVPLLAQAFLRNREKPTLPIVFLVAGLCANIDFFSGVNLVAVMVVALLGLGRFRVRSWALAGGGVAAAAIGAAPAICHYYSVFAVVRAAGPPVTASALLAAYETAGTAALYPRVIVEGLRWLPVAALLAIPPGVILTRAGRWRLQDLRGWVWLLVSAGIVAFGALGLVQLVAWAMGTLPRRLELFDAIRLGMLPLYVLFAQSMVHLTRLTRTNRRAMQAVFLVFLLVFLGSSYNTLSLRHLVQEGVATLGETDRLRPPHGRDREELRAIGAWASAHTPPEALFVSPKEEIRLYGQRSLAACPSDFEYLLNLAPGRLDDWTDLLVRQRRLLSPPESPRANPDHIAAFVDRYWQRRRLPPAETYVVVPAASAPAPSGRVQAVEPPGDLWGNHFRLYRVLLSQPASGGS